MKRNNLTTAVVAGLAGIAGLASVSNATVSLNSDGLGQVLIYPYYTVNNNLQTLFSVVNTTNLTKAVKVRFLEGKNSREVLDFNLYLSPYDVWTASLNSDKVNRGPFGIFTNHSHYDSYTTDMDTVVLKTDDTSCTAPLVMNNQQFKPFQFDQTTGVDATGIRNMSRAREGHIEVIEMGIVVDNSVSDNAITHNQPAGVPSNCGTIANAWFGTAAQRYWSNTGGAQDMEPDFGFNNAWAGGLYGTVAIVDVANGFEVSYNADAIQGFRRNLVHTPPGDLLPNVGSVDADNISATPFGSAIFTNGGVVQSNWPTGVESVSALYIHDHIYNDYVITDLLAAETEWVVTFPTKKFYVDPQASIGLVPVEPFTDSLSTSGACEEFGGQYFNREEGVPTFTSCPPTTIPFVDPDTGVLICVSPPSPLPPPGENPDAPTLCWETNVVQFTSDETLLATDIPTTVLGSTSKRGYFLAENATDTDLDTNWSTGWVDMSFTKPDSLTQQGQYTLSGVEALSGAPQTYVGLPVTGFAVQRLANVAEGKLFGTIFKHKGSRNITSATGSNP